MYDQVAPALGAANYARASVHSDFMVPGPPATLVDVQVSTTFDFTGRLFSAGAYKAATSLTIHLLDLTVGRVIASHTLFEQERSGDQGISDVTGSSETQAVFGNTSAFHATLRRGHNYRLEFEVEVLGEALVVGKTHVEAFATWTRSRINVDEDEVDLLRDHDADVKSELAEIQRKLDEQAAQLAEIKRLLLTPQGRREGFPIK